MEGREKKVHGFGSCVWFLCYVTLVERVARGNGGQILVADENLRDAISVNSVALRKDELIDTDMLLNSHLQCCCCSCKGAESPEVGSRR